MSKPPRKRIKLECQKCGSQFDDDYRSRHETAKHNGKRVPVKHVGAPLNPFEASRKKPRITRVLPSSTSSSSSSPSEAIVPESYEKNLPQNEKPLDRRPSVPSTKLNADQQVLQPSPSLLSSRSPSPVSPKTTSPISSQPLSGSPLRLLPKEDKVDILWISFSGKIAEFLTNFERADDILKTVKNEAVPNLKVFFVDMIDCLSNIRRESDEVIATCNERGENFFT